MAGAIQIDIKELGNTEALLKGIDPLLRNKALVAALKKSGRVVVAKAKALCPKGGPRINTKAGKKHLKDTITSAVRDYGDTKVLVVGPAYPAGAHGHLVEFGTVPRRHKSGKNVGAMPPRPFLRPAVESTLAEQKSAFEAELRAHIEKA